MALSANQISSLKAPTNHRAATKYQFETPPKSIGFISHVHGVHFAREDEDEGRFIFRFGRRGNSLSTRLATSTVRLQSLVLPGQELSDSAKLLTDIIARLPSLKQTFRRIQRFAPELRQGQMSIEERNSCRDAVQQGTFSN